MTPTAPSWFVKLLKQEHKDLTVDFNISQKQWQISQYIPYNKYYGVYDGIHLWRVERRKEKVLFTPGLGSKIIHDLKQQWNQNYDSLDDFVKKMKIKVNENPAAEVNAELEYEAGKLRKKHGDNWFEKVKNG